LKSYNKGKGKVRGGEREGREWKEGMGEGERGKGKRRDPAKFREKLTPVVNKDNDIAIMPVCQSCPVDLSITCVLLLRDGALRERIITEVC